MAQRRKGLVIRPSQLAHDDWALTMVVAPGGVPAMRYIVRHVLLAGATIALAACSWGDSKPPRKAPEEWHPPAEMLEKYAGKDGIVTRAEMEAGLRVDFAKADVNQDGCLDANEARVVNEERWKESASTASPLIDFKHTGCIDFEEFAATPRSLFDMLDKKGVGRLTPAQLHPGRRPPPAASPPAPAKSGS